MEIRTKLITDLPLSEVLGGSEIFPVNQFGVAKKSSTQDIIEFTKKQNYATWVNQASTNLKTIDLSTRYLNLYNVPLNQEAFPEFFIGEAGFFSYQGEVSSLSGFKYHYNDQTDRFVFVSYSSSVSANVRNLTAYYVNSNAFMYITNLSTSNTLSARNIYVTDQITISANSNNDALFIVQNGQGNAIQVFDESNDTTPFVVTASGNVGIKTPNPLIDLTIFGNVSSSATLSGRNVHVMERLGVATARPNETLTVFGNISASGVIYDRRLNSDRWFETFTNYSAGSANEAMVATFVNKNSANIVNVNTKVNNTSANWDSVFSHMQANTGSIYAARTYVGNNSANFSDSVSKYNNLSATYAPFSYVNAGFLPLSGGEVSSGTVRISGLTTFGSDVVILGRLSANLLTVLKTESIPITASTLNVDGSGRFGGTFQLDGQVRVNNNLTVTGFANVSSTITADNIITSRQYLRDLNGDSRDWNSAYARWNAVSALDLQVRNFVNPNSANINQVTSKVNLASSNWDRSFTVTSQTSANWNSNFSTWNANSALDLAARTYVNSNSSNINNVNTTVNNTSANWNSNYSTWNANSALDLAARTYVNSNSSKINNVNTTVNNTSANWNSNFSSWNANSALDLAARTYVNSNSSNINNVNTTVNNTSANWNSNYSHWNSNSGLIFMTRNFVTSNSANSLEVNTRVNQSSANWNSAYSSFFNLSAAIGEGLTEFQESSARYNRVSTRVEVTSANWNSVYTTFQSNSGKYNSDRGVISIAAAGSTTVTVPSHTLGTMDVYLNGVKLVNGTDFTETATSIILSEPTKYANYTLEYVVYGAYNVANAVAKTGDVMTGNLTVPNLTVNTAFTVPTMALSRNDTGSEGGQLQLNRSSDNTEKYFIDVYGATANPTLRIFEKTGSSPNFQFPERISILGGSGNVGINNGNPAYARLSIYQNSTDDYALAVTNDTANTGDGFLVDNYSTTSNAALIVNRGSGTALFVRQEGTGYSLFVEDQLSDSTPALAIDSDGNIGMGTPPLDGNVRLEIKGKQSVPNASPDVRISSTNGGTLMVLDNAQVGNYGPLTQANDILVSYYGSGGVNTGGFTLAQWATSNKGIRITPAGNVGINTPNANQTLTVSGSISATGSITANGFVGDATGLYNLDITKKFYKFPNQDNIANQARMNFFISEDRRLYVAGADNYGWPQAGINNDIVYTRFGFHSVEIPEGEVLNVGEKIENIFVNHTNKYILTNQGNLLSIGANYYSQLGTGTADGNRAWWKKINLQNVRHFSCPNNISYQFWSLYNAAPYYGMFPWAYAVTTDGRVYAWGWQGGTDFATDVAVPTLITTGDIVNKNIVKVFTQTDQNNSTRGTTFAIDSNRDIYAKGESGAMLGIDGVARTAFTKIPNMKADKVVANKWTNSGTTFIQDGTSLFSCGSNEYGQLGVATVTTSRNNLVQISGLSPGVKDFHANGYHNGTVAVIRTDGKLMTWGRNALGQLGRNGTTNDHVPRIPDGLSNINFKKVIVFCGAWAANDYTTVYALSESGDMYASGYGGNGQIGRGPFPMDASTYNRFFKKMLFPSSDKVVDFYISGWAGGTVCTVVTERGDLYSCGHNATYACGIAVDSTADLYHPRRCLIN